MSKKLDASAKNRFQILIVHLKNIYLKEKMYIF